MPSLFSFLLDRDHIDNKGDQGEQHPRLLEADGVGGSAEGSVKANKEIGHQGAQHVIGTHRWNGIVVQRSGIARRSPDDDRDADHHRDQQAIDQRKRLETCAQSNQHQQ